MAARKGAGDAITARTGTVTLAANATTNFTLSATFNRA